MAAVSNGLEKAHDFDLWHHPPWVWFQWLQVLNKKWSTRSWCDSKGSWRRSFVLTVAGLPHQKIGSPEEYFPFTLSFILFIFVLWIVRIDIPQNSSVLQERTSRRLFIIFREDSGALILRNFQQRTWFFEVRKVWSQKFQLVAFPFILPEVINFMFFQCFW